MGSSCERPARPTTAWWGPGPDGFPRGHRPARYPEEEDFSPDRAHQEGEAIQQRPNPVVGSPYAPEDYDLPFPGPTGPPSGVPEPPLGKAMGIILLVLILQIFAGFLIGLFFAGGAMALPGPRVNLAARLMANLIALPVNLLILAGLIAGLLPTRFGKGILVALLYLLICLLIGVVVLVLFFAIALTFRLLAGP